MNFNRMTLIAFRNVVSSTTAILALASMTGCVIHTNPQPQTPQTQAGTPPATPGSTPPVGPIAPATDLPEGCAPYQGRLAFAVASEDSCDAAKCGAAGGECGSPGPTCPQACIFKTSDAAKACTDLAQCEGDCIAPEGIAKGVAATGQCSPLKVASGCKNRMRGGQASGVLCVD